MQQQGKKELNIIVVGKPGSGKSTFLKQLTQSNQYKVAIGAKSVTQWSDCQFNQYKIGGYTINLLDTPGLGDSKESYAKSLNTLNQKIGNETIHMVIIVVQSTNRCDSFEKFISYLLKNCQEQLPAKIFQIYFSKIDSLINESDECEGKSPDQQVQFIEKIIGDYITEFRSSVCNFDQNSYPQEQIFQNKILGFKDKQNYPKISQQFYQLMQKANLDGYVQSIRNEEQNFNICQKVIQQGAKACNIPSELANELNQKMEQELAKLKQQQQKMTQIQQDYRKAIGGCGKNTTCFTRDGIFMGNSGKYSGGCGSTKDHRRVYRCYSCNDKIVAWQNFNA